MLAPAQIAELGLLKATASEIVLWEIGTTTQLTRACARERRDGVV